MLQRSSGFLPPVHTTCRVGFGVFSVKPDCHRSGSSRNLLVYLPPAHRVKKTRGYYALRGNCYTWGSGGVCAWNRARAVQCELYRLACTRQLELIRKRKLGKLTTRHFLSHVQHELPVFLIGLA